MSSCSQDDGLEVNEEGMIKHKFKAYHGTTYTAGTRTQINSDGKTVVWQANEEIGVFSGTTLTSYTIADGQGTAAASFTGYSPENPNGGYYGISPYNENATIADNKVSNLVVPVHQTATKGTYDPKAAVMTSYTTDNTMVFMHVCSFIKIVVGEDDEMKHLMRISIEAMESDKTTPGRPIAGTFDATITKSGSDQSVATVSNITHGSNKISLEPKVGEELTAGTYYIAVLPGDMDCFVIRFETVQKSLMRRLPVTKQYNRAEIKNLGTFPGATWTWTEEKKQELIYSGEYTNNAGKRIFFAAGNLQAVMSGDPSDPIREWRFAEHQYDFEGIGTATTPTGNRKVYRLGMSDEVPFADGDVVDMFAWVANKNNSGTEFTTDPLLKYGITNKASLSSGSTSNYLSNVKTTGLYSGANSSADWGAAYKASSGSTRDWKVLDNNEWNNSFIGRSGSLARGYSTCRVTKEGGGTVFGIWIYPTGSGSWPEIPSPCTYDDYMAWIAKGCMFFPACNYMTGTSVPSTLATNVAYYWASNAYCDDTKSGSNMYWYPYQVAYKTGLAVNQGSVNQRCFVRLYTESQIEN